MITPDLSKKDFSLTEIVLGGHDELEVSQLSLLPGSGRAGSEIGLGEVRSGLQGLGSYICTCTHMHTRVHTHTTTKSSETQLRAMQGQAEAPGGWG